MVSKERGEALARSQDVPFLETSAKTNYNIDEAFEKLARHILRKVGVMLMMFSLHCLKKGLVKFFNPLRNHSDN